MSRIGLSLGNKFITAIEAINFFDEVHIEKAGYIPVAHDDNETKQRQLLESAVAVLQGKQSLKMDVASFPTNPQVAENYQKMIAQLASITGGGALKVSNT